MAGKKSHTEPEHDHDSFLDIVANIVGILIILVMVVSMRAREAPNPAAETGPAEQELRKHAIQHAALEQDIARLIMESSQLDDYLEVRAEERHRLSVLLATAEDEISTQRGKLSKTERELDSLESKISVAKEDLEQLHIEHIAAAAIEAPVAAIEHYPTPIGKSVYGREVHFQLLAGRITHLPIDALFNEARAQARQKVWKLDKLPEATEIVGPRGGFHMRYTLEKIPLPREVQMETGRTGFMIRSKLWELIPTSTQLGEPLEDALQGNSSLRAHLAKMDPESTTITLWTYPDSFSTFCALKKELFTMGFDAAARPLPRGVRIAGSPSGSRSTAQ